MYATVDASLVKVSAGAPIAFTGTVTNSNTYAVSNVSVYAKVLEFRSQNKDVNGPDVVAWLPIASGVQLNAKQSKPLSYVWQVPSDLKSGNYEFATYVVIDDRFNMSGLSFTDDVIGNNASFTVLSQHVGAVRFDKDAITVNGEPFHSASYPPTIPQGTPSIPISIGVTNTTDIPYEGTVTWNLYSWDGLRSAKLINTSTEDLKAEPNASTTLSYTATLSVPASVYYVTGEFKTKGGATSFIDIRFVQDGVNIPRLGFVGANGGTAFACVHSMGDAAATGGKLELSVQDTSPVGTFLSFFGLGNSSSATYTGQIPGNIYALTVPIKGNLPSYMVTAKLYQNGVLLDTVTMPYGHISTLNYLVVTLLAILIVLVLVALLIRHSRKKVSPPQIPLV